MQQQQQQVFNVGAQQQGMVVMTPQQVNLLPRFYGHVADINIIY